MGGGGVDPAPPGRGLRLWEGTWICRLSTGPRLPLPVWEKVPERRRRSYGVALCFALPGLMSMFALIDVQTPVFRRVSFGIVAVGGAVIMALVRGSPVAPRRDEAGRRALPGADRLGLAAYAAAIVLYVLIGLLAAVAG